MSVKNLGLITLGQLCGHDIHQRERDGKIEVTQLRRSDDYPSLLIANTVQSEFGAELVELIESKTGREAYYSRETGDVLWLHPSLFLLYVAKHYATPDEVRVWKDKFFTEALSHPSLSLPDEVWSLVPTKVKHCLAPVEPEHGRLCTGYAYLEPDSVVLGLGDTSMGVQLVKIERVDNKVYLYIKDGTLIVQELLDNGHMIGLTYDPVGEPKDLTSLMEE